MLRLLVTAVSMLIVWFLTACQAESTGPDIDSMAGVVADGSTTSEDSGSASELASNTAESAQSTETSDTSGLNGPAMGTTWSVKLAESIGSKTRVELESRIVEELQRINRLVSTWDPKSELSRFNENPSLEPASLDDNTLSILNTAMDVSRLTAGAYDVTIGPVIDAWGFGAAETHQPPTESDLKEAMAATGYKTLTLGKSTVQKKYPATKIDLSSLAKGDAVDRLAALLEAAGYTSFLVEIGGEVRASGHRSDGKPWLVGIEQPDGDVSEGLALTDLAVASSGSYRNYRESNGIRVSHIIDARSGQPISHDLVAVTILQSTTRLADAWATALLVVGNDEAWRIATDNGWAVQLTLKTDDGFEVRRTREFEQLVAGS